MEARENPFALARLERLAFRLPAGLTYDLLMERLAGQQNLGSIVGRHGSGKSRLLRDLEPHLRSTGFEPVYFRLTTESSKREKEQLGAEFRKVVSPGFILLDGAELLSTRHWLSVRAAASQAAGIVITIFRVSRLPLLVECDTSAELLQDLVEEVSGTRLFPGEPESLLARHHGDIRACLAELRELWDSAPVPIN